jgi:hypothetical protein
MKKIEIDIPLEAYTDNVRKIVTDPLRECYGDGAWEAIKDPATSVEDLKNALRILEEKNEPRTKRKIEKIKKEIKSRKNFQKCKEKAIWWHPFRSEKEGREFIHRWNEVTGMIKGGVQHE